MRNLTLKIITTSLFALTNITGGGESLRVHTHLSTHNLTAL